MHNRLLQYGRVYSNGPCWDWSLTLKSPVNNYMVNPNSYRNLKPRSEFLAPIMF